MRKRIINSHTMKVFVTKGDLKINGITALDLLGDHNQIEEFFYKILDKVDTHHLFTNHEPLTFRVLPNKNGLEIIISSHSKQKRLLAKNSRNVKSTLGKSFANNVVKLGSFERFISIAHVLVIDHGDSILYKYDDSYYLNLKFVGRLDQPRINAIKNKLAIVYEYGDPTDVSESTLRDQGKVIMKHHALETGRHYFH